MISHGPSRGRCKAEERSQASGVIPLAEESQAKAGCDKHCQSDEGNPFNKTFGKKAALLQSLFDTIKDVENLLSPYLLKTLWQMTMSHRRRD